MGAEYIKRNYNGLKKGLGRSNLTDVDVYMAHFLGLGGALKFFRADPQAMAYKVFSKEYSANMPLFFVNSKPGQPRTISQVYKLFQDKIEKFWATSGKGLREGGGDTVTAGDVGQTAGAEAPPKSEEELTKERLAADAKDKSGVAAQADPNAPAGPGTEAANAESKDTAGQPTVASIANSSGPMPSAPATGGGASTSSPSADSGGGSVDSQRDAVLAQAQSNNTRRAEEVRKDQAAASNVDQYNTKMLGATLEIRDLMKTLVEKMQNTADGSGGSSSGGEGGNSMTPNSIQKRQAAERPSALTLK
jgi:hypothetical protein